jgi:hypothetical protein
MTRFLHEIAARYPTKSALYEIGKTEGGKMKFEFFHIEAYFSFKDDHYGQ